MKKSSSFLLIILIPAACGTGDISREFTKTQMIFMLSAGKSKIWKRIARKESNSNITFGECEANNTLAFVISSGDSLMYRLGHRAGCSDPAAEADTLLKAKWSLTQDSRLTATDTLQLTELDTDKVLPSYVARQLTGRKLSLIFSDENNNQITEEYIF